MMPSVTTTIPVPHAPTTPIVHARPDEATIYGRLEKDLVACYEKGKKLVPTMLDGKLTMSATIDAAGRTTCVIPVDDKGLTQEVEDCMSARFAAERFGEGPATTVEVPVVVRGGKVSLGSQTRTEGGLDSVETHRMPDAFEEIETLLPELQTCTRRIDRNSAVRSLVVGARVGTDGRTSCALASGAPTALPADVADCAADVFRRAKFPPPTGGPGLVLVPIRLQRR